MTTVTRCEHCGSMDVYLDALVNCNDATDILDDGNYWCTSCDEGCDIVCTEEEE